jgi:GT2 family glycosyltransferase
VVSVSIAIPNYNGGIYLYETLKSLEMQTVAPEEIVISDNFSTDNSLEVIGLFPNLKIRVVHPDRFLSMSKNWNYVSEQINSDWFFLLSNDDLLRNTAIEHLKKVVDNLAPNVGIVSFKSEIIDENSKLLLGKYKLGKSKIWSEKEFLIQNIRFLKINAASVAIKKDTWIDSGKFPDEYEVIHDLVFYQRAVSRWNIFESKEILGRYRVYNNKPSSRERSALAMKDFLTYERTDLRSHTEKYPELLEIYANGRNEFPSIFLRMKSLLREVVISIMTVARVFESYFRFSGFPNRDLD